MASYYDSTADLARPEASGEAWAFARVIYVAHGGQYPAGPPAEGPAP